MKLLITGGAGFIGRWVVAEALRRGADVWVLDDLSNGRRENLREFGSRIRDFREGSIGDERILADLFGRGMDLCLHMAARINVQDSIDNPRDTFASDVVGTFNVLQEARARSVPVLFMSTCMVYERAAGGAIDETHPTRPASPYAACKLAAEALTLSYWHAYGLPAVVVRPFNTYGPFQKSNTEGGVVSVFCERALSGRTLDIFGDGAQTRDLLFVTDCARFVMDAATSREARGTILNAGSGRDVSINDLAAKICPDPSRIRHVPHIHPRSEIMKLQCDYSRARNLLGWEPAVAIEEGIARVTDWLKAEGRGEGRR